MRSLSKGGIRASRDLLELSRTKDRNLPKLSRMEDRAGKQAA